MLQTPLNSQMPKKTTLTQSTWNRLQLKKTLYTFWSWPACCTSSSLLHPVFFQTPVDVPSEISDETFHAAQVLYHIMSAMRYFLTTSVTAIHNVILSPIKSIEMLKKRKGQGNRQNQRPKHHIALFESQSQRIEQWKHQNGTRNFGKTWLWKDWEGTSP